MFTPLTNGNYMQLCWVVPDLEAAIGHWVRSARAGPFFVFEDVHFSDSHYRGTPATSPPPRRHRPIRRHADRTDCPHRQCARHLERCRPRRKSGFHHTALYCSDYDAEQAAYAAEGVEVAFEGLMMGAKTCYLDTVTTLGFMTELITANPIADQVFAAFRAAAQGWDGSDPIRSLG